MHLFIFTFFLFLILSSDVDFEFEDDEEELIGTDRECALDFWVPGPDETIEFRFPDVSHVTRSTIISEDNYITFKAFDVPVPKGVGIYFRTSPFNASSPRFVKNRYMDSGVNMELINGTTIVYPDNNKLFLNYKYQSIPQSNHKCREYDIWIRFSMNDMVKYGRNGVKKEGMFIELVWFYGYFVRNLNQTSPEEPFFIYSENLINAIIGMSKNEQFEDTEL